MLVLSRSVREQIVIQPCQLPDEATGGQAAGGGDQRGRDETIGRRTGMTDTSHELAPWRKGV
jgi:hypothetical protein